MFGIRASTVYWVTSDEFPYLSKLAKLTPHPWMGGQNVD